eukprot:767125-Hanusia_phi.AAC.9
MFGFVPPAEATAVDVTFAGKALEQITNSPKRHDRNRRAKGRKCETTEPSEQSENTLNRVLSRVKNARTQSYGSYASYDQENKPPANMPGRQSLASAFYPRRGDDDDLKLQTLLQKYEEAKSDRLKIQESPAVRIPVITRITCEGSEEGSHADESMAESNGVALSSRYVCVLSSEVNSLRRRLEEAERRYTLLEEHHSSVRRLLDFDIEEPSGAYNEKDNVSSSVQDSQVARVINLRARKVTGGVM